MVPRSQKTNEISVQKVMDWISDNDNMLRALAGKKIAIHVSELAIVAVEDSLEKLAAEVGKLGLTGKVVFHGVPRVRLETGTDLPSTFVCRCGDKLTWSTYSNEVKSWAIKHAEHKDMSEDISGSIAIGAAEIAKKLGMADAKFTPVESVIHKIENVLNDLSRQIELNSKLIAERNRWKTEAAAVLESDSLSGAVDFVKRMSKLGM